MLVQSVGQSRRHVQPARYCSIQVKPLHSWEYITLQ
jgi:hypothetical protein